MASTFTANQFSFTSGDLVSASTLTYNFWVYRGDLVPISEATRGPVSGSYNLGTSEYKWRYAYFQRLGLFQYALGTASLTFQSIDETAGAFDILVNGSTLGTARDSYLAWNRIGVFGSTQTANLGLFTGPDTTGAFDFKISGTTALTMKVKGVSPLSVKGITSTTHLTFSQQPAVTAGAFDVKIGATTATVFNFAGSSFVTLTLDGITTTTNFYLERDQTANGFFNFKIGSAIAAIFLREGTNFNGPTTTANLLIQHNNGTIGGTFDFKIGGVTIATLDTGGFRHRYLSVKGITTTTNLTFQAQAGVTAGAFDVNIGAATAAVFNFGGSAFGTLTLNGITTTTNLMIEPISGVTEGAFRFRIGSTNGSAMLISRGFGFMGPTSTTNLTFIGSSSATTGSFEIKIGSTTVGVWSINELLMKGTLTVIGQTTTAHLYISNSPTETTGGMSVKIGTTEVVKAESDFVSQKKRYAISGLVDDTIQTTTARNVSGATVTLTTTGGPVFITFQNDTLPTSCWIALYPQPGNSQTAWFNILRNGTTIGQYGFRRVQQAAAAGMEMSFPPTMFKYWDMSAPAGDNVYVIQCGVLYTGGSVDFGYCKMLAVEV